MKRGKSNSKWGDLEDLDIEELKKLIRQKKDLLSSLNSEIGELKLERKSQVDIAKSLRSAIGGFEESNSGRKKLLGDFQKIRREAQKLREKRDSINKCIPPPTNILEEWLNDTYHALTKIDNDLTVVPMLNPELAAFSRFFEIQASIKRKREAEGSHQEYVIRVRKMRDISSSLDENKEESKKAFAEFKEDTDLDEEKVSRKEIRRVSKSISLIDSKMEEAKKSIRYERKDLRRMEEYSKIATGRPGRAKMSEIRGIAATGGSLSAEEMGALLETGGLATIAESNEESKDLPREGRGPKKRGRKLGVSRRGSRKGNVAARKE
ncbi:MAG: hypothetical protein CMB67_04280 [Euryarchaeota archaeon]|nr:hypothetical protein [Euryarchaeota archaeon]